MNRRYAYVPLSIICVLALTVIGCTTTHTIEHGQEVEAFYNPWLDQSFEELLEKHPDPQQSIPIGQGNYRHTFVYDIDTQAEIAVNLLATLGEMGAGRDDLGARFVHMGQHREAVPVGKLRDAGQQFGRGHDRAGRAERP